MPTEGRIVHRSPKPGAARITETYVIVSSGRAGWIAGIVTSTLLSIRPFNNIVECHFYAVQPRCHQNDLIA